MQEQKQNLCVARMSRSRAIEVQDLMTRTLNGSGWSSSGHSNPKNNPPTFRFDLHKKSYKRDDEVPASLGKPNCPASRYSMLSEMSRMNIQ